MTSCWMLLPLLACWHVWHPSGAAWVLRAIDRSPGMMVAPSSSSSLPPLVHRYYGCLMEIDMDHMCQTVVENDGLAPTVTVLGPGRRGYVTLGCWTASDNDQAGSDGDDNGDGEKSAQADSSSFRGGGGGAAPVNGSSKGTKGEFGRSSSSANKKRASGRRPHTVVGCGFGYSTSVIFAHSRAYIYHNSAVLEDSSVNMRHHYSRCCIYMRYSSG